MPSLKPPDNTRIVFLDVDGVLNSHEWYKSRGGLLVTVLNNDCTMEEHAKSQLDPAAIERVNVLCERTGAVVVVSSTWRGNMFRLMLGLREHRRFEVIDKTPKFDDGIRGLEIQWWMDRHNVNADQIVILDDDSDMVHLMPRLVKTSFEAGFTDECLERAVALLQ